MAKGRKRRLVKKETAILVAARLNGGCQRARGLRFKSRFVPFRPTKNYPMTPPRPTATGDEPCGKPAVTVRAGMALCEKCAAAMRT